MKFYRRQIALFLAVVIAVTFMIPAFAGATSASPQISVPAAALIDYETGIVLFEHNARTQRVPASMIKMVAVFVVLDEIAAGRASMDTQILISPETAQLSRRAGWSNVPLNAGEHYSIRELLEIIIVRSANGATVALGEGLFGSEDEFVRRMNAKARELNIRAHFADSFGISPNNRISPLAMAWFMRRLLLAHPVVLEFTSMESVTFRGGNPLNNTNHLLTRYSGTDGLKTGFTSAAGFCIVASATRDGRRLIAVTMGGATS